MRIAPRFIPVLLVDRDRRVVKTVCFGERTYVGDPFNIVRLFNEKEVDEICVLDIDATVDGRPPDMEFARALASECFMPLAYGGGISTIEQVRVLARDGIEKFVLRSHATPGLIEALAHEFGSQAVVGCVDYRGSAETGRVDGSERSPAAVAAAMVEAGVGEIILQSIDRDGCRDGMNLSGIGAVAPSLSVPVVALGGAGGASDLQDAITHRAGAAASGSAFCFIGRLRAVLVTYPAYEERLSMAGLR